MSNEQPHEILDISTLREQIEEKSSSPLEEATKRLQGKKFSELSDSDKEELLMVIGCRVGILVPENSES